MVKQFISERLSRCRVEDHRNSMAGSNGSRSLYHSQIRLQLHDDNSGLADNRFKCFNIGRLHLDIRTGDHNNPVLAFSVHHNGGDSSSL
jgi:hypothetical protein